MNIATSGNRKNEPDFDLISSYRNSHDAEYVGELYQRYAHLIFGTCLKYLKNKEESKDACMEIFDKLLIDLKKHNVDNFQSWLYSVVKNHCLMKIRQSSTPEQREEEFKMFTSRILELMEIPHLSNGFDKDELLARLDIGVNALKPQQARCIRLFYIEGKTMEEIAEKTSFTEDEIKDYLAKGKRNLKVYMAKQIKDLT